MGKKTITFIMGQNALHSEKALCGESPYRGVKHLLVEIKGSFPEKEAFQVNLGEQRGFLTGEL